MKIYVTTLTLFYEDEGVIGVSTSPDKEEYFLNRIANEQYEKRGYESPESFKNDSYVKTSEHEVE